MDSVYKVTFDQCAVGLKVPGGSQPIRKRTTLLTNSKHIKELFEDKQCECEEDHVQIQGSYNGVPLSKHCQIYPEQFCALLAKAVELHHADSQA